jgi:hypothetical protein
LVKPRRTHFREVLSAPCCMRSHVVCPRSGDRRTCSGSRRGIKRPSRTRSFPGGKQAPDGCNAARPRCRLRGALWRRWRRRNVLAAASPAPSWRLRGAMRD